jgi:hypothetical protein
VKTIPQLASRQLGGPTDVGQVINVNGSIALVAVAPQDPNKPLQLAIFDSAKDAFVAHLYHGETALIFRGELTFEPDLSNPIAEASPNANSGSDVFFDGKDFYVVLRLINGTDFRLLSLSTGNIVSWNNQSMHVFPSYRLGVAGASGEISWVLRA